jgi:hypothetical protein
MRYITLSLLLICFAACKKNDCHSQPDNDGILYADYYVFGVTGGLCPECYHYYKIENNQLYQDSILFPSPVFHQQPMSAADYLLAKQLVDQFPAYLQNNPGQTYGCPGCADQRSFYIEIKQGADTITWRIDEIEDVQPVAIRPYVQQMDAIINQLQ